MTAVTICSDFGAPQNKISQCFHCFLSYLPWSNRTGCHDNSFLNAEFKPAFSLSSFPFIKKFFSTSSLSAIRVVSSAYLRLLIFFQTILYFIQPGFCMMSSAYQLNKQDDNIQPWHTPFLILNQAVVPCAVLTVASWPAYRFLRRQVRRSGNLIFWRIFHCLLWSTQSKAVA